MRTVLGAVTGVLMALSAGHLQADETAAVMCEQFAIKGATKTVETTPTFSDDFSPKHHAPRNIPIEVQLPEGEPSYIHFPIVETGTYIVYASTPERLAGIELKSGDKLQTQRLGASAGCPDALPGGLSVAVSGEKITGPTPIAIAFTQGDGSTLRLIVSRDPIN